MPRHGFPHDRPSPKILYIEDNAENRMLARAVLEAAGYTVVEAEDGLAGIEAAIREDPALILLDINLPGVNGYEVVAVLKSFPAVSTTPVIALTAYAMDGDRQRTLVAGCDGYLQKPIDVDTLPRQVAEFLEGKRERVEEREEGVYLRELNQRLVYRLVNQVENLKRLNDHFVRRAGQLEDLHRVFQDMTSELEVRTLLERLLAGLVRALGTTRLTVELSEPAGLRVTVRGDEGGHPRSMLRNEPAEDWNEVEWTIPLMIRGRPLGLMRAHHVLPPGAKADEENLVKIVANQVATAVENSRLYADVTRKMAELKQAQAQLIQSTKLAAIGELVANIAHELNNPLTSVLGFASYLIGALKPGDPMREELTLIQQEAVRARDIVRDLLQFSRQSQFRPEPADLNAVVEQTVAMVRRQAGLEHVVFYEIYAPDLPAVEVDVPRIKQVFVNLINNALHAMPDGGSVTIHSAAADGFVQVEFADTGTGIAPGHLDRIFEPFFTTKPDVSGTGLGLSVSLGIVQSHDGTIEVKSELGKGSTFTVKLPIKAGVHSDGANRSGPQAGAGSTPGRASPAATLAPTSDGPVSLSGLRILVVEDDRPVQDLVRAYLEAAGGTTVGVPNADEALKRLDGAVDLIVSDLYLPGMDGLTFYREVSARHPALRRRFLLMTGGLVTEAVQAFMAEANGKLLRKPFSREELLEVVRDVLR
ncbi:MAG: response regulator [Candidatus Rokubacteria bacterium]|nr:response regulator [Candidatus Rokubacteria bacterium]